MRIYSRQEFLKLPVGTIYCKGKEWYFDNLCIKGESLLWEDGMGDWYEMDPAWVGGKNSGECFDRLQEMLDKQASYPMQNAECRDGCFEDTDLFLVFEKNDLIILRDYIEQAIANCN